MILKKIIKKLYHYLKNRHIRIDIKLPMEWYGSNYGGFYVHDSIISKYKTVLSFGIGEDISFDKQIIKNKKCLVYGFDPTPKSIKFIKNHCKISNFKFFDFGLGKSSGTVKFNLPKNNKHVSGSVLKSENLNTNNSIEVQMKSFTDILKTISIKNIVLVKMDIEGSEYDIYDSIIRLENKVPLICMEIHERFFDDGKSKTKKLLKNFRNEGYLLYGVSKNFQELSFIHNNYV